MTSGTQDQRLAFEAAIRANAIAYSVQLFLGRGQFERAHADTLGEAVAIGAAMKAAHPACQALPIFYAIEPSGHSTTITPAQFQETIAMIKTAVTTESASIDVINAEALKRAKNAERMRASRAHAKAENGLRASLTASIATANAAEATTEAAEMIGPEEIPEAEIPAFLLGGDGVMAGDFDNDPAAREPSPDADISAGMADANIADEAPKATNGLCMTKTQATAEARAVYGALPVIIKKTARGDWFWGPLEAPKATMPKLETKVDPRRTPRDVASALVKKATPGRHAEALAAAERGIIPDAPDFSPPSHAPFRKKLAALVAMVEAGDVAALKAETTEPKSSSRVMLCRYRHFAIIALSAAKSKQAA